MVFSWIIRDGQKSARTCLLGPCEGRERRAADGGGEHTIYPEDLWANQRSSGRARGGGHMLHVRPEHNCGDEDGRAILVSLEAGEPGGHAETQHTFVCSGRTWDMRHVA
jgi:hypothetical protein